MKQDRVRALVALKMIAQGRVGGDAVVAFARKVLAGVSVATARAEAEAEVDTELCEGCAVRVPLENVKRDSDGVPLCRECFASLPEDEGAAA